MAKKGNGKLKSLMASHPVLANFLIILCIAVLGIVIVHFSIAVFTKHGESDKVPGVENMSYTEAVRTLHNHGFRVDIRDSLYQENVLPGHVIEQFPKANSIVKPGRKIFLYINAVHPKEVVIDDDNNPSVDALKSYSFRQGMARLEELGFKKIRVVKIPGTNELIVRVLSNGKTVKKMQRVPINSSIVVEVYDGRFSDMNNPELNDEYTEEFVNPVLPNEGEDELEYLPEPDINTESSEEIEGPNESGYEYL